MKKVRNRKNRNYLPENVGNGFEEALKVLINSVTSDGTFRSMYLRDEVFSKYLDEGLVSADDRRAAAIKKWSQSEEQNRSTNVRLYLMEEKDFGWATADDILDFASGIIASVLGPFSVFWDKESSLFYDTQMGSHTNGASTRVKRSEIAALLKHSEEAHVTASAIPWWDDLSAGTILAQQEYAHVSGSVLFTVPKKTDIDRVACKEPEINMFLQRIAGGHIRRRLKRNGINLNDQSRNQELAKRAWSDGLATVDLSAASDSITHQLVLRLLPFDWYAYLDEVRVHETLIDGFTHQLEMFSSMGNGFTFELESLIFWALTRSVCRFSQTPGTISVYGDDIICPASVVPRLSRFFHYIGFLVNPKKSHWTGGFRESCGKHYYFGTDVTPFYVRGKVSSMVDVIKTLNQILIWSSEGSFIIYDEMLAFHRKWVNIVPRYLWGGVDPEDTCAVVTGHGLRKRLIPDAGKYRSSDSIFHQKKSDESYSSAGLACWLTVRCSVDEPFDTSSTYQKGFRVTGYPSWQKRTSWQPWLMAVLDAMDT